MDWIAAKLVKRKCEICDFLASATTPDNVVLLLACHCLHLHGIDEARVVLAGYFSPEIAAVILLRVSQETR